MLNIWHHLTRLLKSIPLITSTTPIGKTIKLRHRNQVVVITSHLDVILVFPFPWLFTFLQLTLGFWATHWFSFFCFFFFQRCLQQKCASCKGIPKFNKCWCLLGSFLDFLPKIIFIYFFFSSLPKFQCQLASLIQPSSKFLRGFWAQVFLSVLKLPLFVNKLSSLSLEGE